MAWIVTAITTVIPALTAGQVIAAGAVVGAAAIGAKGNKDATKAGIKGQEKSQAAYDAAVKNAKVDINALFGKAEKSRSKGFGNALDFISGAPARQIAPLQAGNQNAQSTVASGLPQIQNAIMGLPVDFSGLQPKSVGSPESFNLDLSRFLPQPEPVQPAPVQPPPAPRAFDMSKMIGRGAGANGGAKNRFGGGPLMERF